MVKVVYSAKTAELIEMPVGVVSGSGQRNNVLDGSPYLPREGTYFERKMEAMGKMASALQIS